jgi:hypothetical protein
MIETEDAVRRLDELHRLAISRAFIGLNDLAIERRSPTIFQAVADGSVERIRRAFSVPFGFGGATLPDRGSPVPCRLLLGELARLQCDLTFLRRSFHRDTQQMDWGTAIGQIRRAWAELSDRTLEQVERDRIALISAIRRVTEPPEPNQ